MARQISKGKCSFCQGEFSKSSMTRHLESCKERAQAGTGGQQKSRASKKMHLVVEGRGQPMYWMHLEVPADITLATLDRFLRDTWLECCGHLSAFEIGGVRYASDGGMHSGWGTDDKSMGVKLGRVLSPGQTSYYEYDFGTTTELTLKVVGEREGEAQGKAIQVLARNEPPLILCDVCGKPATEVCAQCVYDEGGWLCEECVKDHECGEEMMLPVVNSPRVGMCAYAG